MELLLLAFLSIFGIAIYMVISYLIERLVGDGTLG